MSSSRLEPRVLETVQHSLRASVPIRRLHRDLAEAGTPVSRAQLFRYQKNWRRTGSIETQSRARSGPACRITGFMEDELMAFVDDNPWADQSDMSAFLLDVFGVVAAQATVSRSLRRRRYVRKRAGAVTAERKIVLRDDWLRERGMTLLGQPAAIKPEAKARP